MTLPVSGPISLKDVNVELGLSGTTSIGMNDASVRTLFGVPSGPISMDNGYGKSNRVTASATISSDTANYTVNTAKASGYVAGKTDFTLTINAGVFVYSGSTGTPALTVDTSWAAGDTVTIINNGIIQGMGGNGGTGGYWAAGYPNGQSGSAGGNALTAQRATIINNSSGVIAGGGGGGGGGSSGQYYNPCEGAPFFNGGGGGGGGRTGRTNSSGGAAGQATSGQPYAAGSPGGEGTSSSAGGGGGGGSNGGGGYTGGSGGTGGDRGTSGSNGGSTPVFGGGAGGGAGGSAVSGNSNITWTAFGTRNGAIT